MTHPASEQKPARAHLAWLLAASTLLAVSIPASNPVIAATAQEQGMFDRGYADLAAQILPSVVNVSVERKAPPGGPVTDPRMQQFFERFFGPEFEAPKRARQQPVRNEGSGFVIDEAGLIVTNAHVVKGADQITVSLQDGRKLKASLRGIDEKTDLALLAVDDDITLPAVAFADSDDVRVGDRILAVGNPFGLGGTVTAGIVSATGRELGSGPYDDFLQLDAAINRGNSGGPTFSLDGEVIGVNTMIFSPSGGNVGIGFAISSNLAQAVIADLADDGVIERGWLGVSIQSLNGNLSTALGLDTENGALISSIVPESPADRAGLAEGDVVLSFDDHAIDKPSTLSKVVAGRDPGSSNRIKIWRDGAPVTLDVELGILSDDAVAVAGVTPEEQVEPTLGLTLAPVTNDDRARLNLEADRSGALVASIEPGSAAERQDIRRGDVILSIDNQPVADPGDFTQEIKQARSNGQQAVALLIARDRGQLFKALTLAGS